jgi:hypothetical protein
MRNVRSTLLAIVVAFALLGAATSPVYADGGPDELVPAALPGVATAPDLPVVFIDAEPALVAPIVFTDSDPVAVVRFVSQAGGGSTDYFDPGDPGLPPD